MKKTKNAIVATNAFSLAEALITLLVICVIAIASTPVITKNTKQGLIFRTVYMPVTGMVIIS